MNDAKEYVQSAKEEILKAQASNLDVYDERLAGMKNIMSALEEDIAKYSSEIDARLEDINLKYEDKTNVILKDLDLRTDALTEKLNDAVNSIDKMLDDKTYDINSEYETLKIQIEKIGKDIDKYMDTVKVFDKAEEMANFIKDDVAKLDVLVNDTKNTVYDMNKTMSEFGELKNMHNTILEYADIIRREKESLKDTQEKVNMLVEMSEEVQSKFMQIAESNSMIENTQEGIKVVIDIASQIENKLSIINDKEEHANTILEKVNIADNESDDILQKIDTIKSAMLDIEDTRREFSDKMYALERDIAKIDKNDEVGRA